MELISWRRNGRSKSCLISDIVVYLGICDVCNVSSCTVYPESTTVPGARPLICGDVTANIWSTLVFYQLCLFLISNGINASIQLLLLLSSPSIYPNLISLSIGVGCYHDDHVQNRPIQHPIYNIVQGTVHTTTPLGRNYMNTAYEHLTMKLSNPPK